MNYKLTDDGVQRLNDGAWIPETTDNRDWVEYQEWIADGNTPLPADVDPVQKPTELQLLTARVEALEAKK